MLVFQYGSNMSSERLNGPDRLQNDALFIAIVNTVKKFELAFNIFSKTNNCAAADLVEGANGRHIMGVLYDVPDFLIERGTAKLKNRKSLDQIEGEGSNYDRISIEVRMPEGEVKNVTTYVVRTKAQDLKTSEAYTQHIVNGLREHRFPQEYFEYIILTIEDNNIELKGKFHVTDSNLSLP